jgi:DNA-binding transcriptional MerR regulator
MKKARHMTGLDYWQIREWGDKGLIGLVERTEGRWRIFSAEQLALLQRIRDLHAEGLSVAEIRAVLQKDGSAIGRHVAKRKGELARLVGILKRLETASAELDDWSSRLSV